MILKLIRFFRGYVDFNIKGRFPERFINLCMRQGYFLFNIISDSKGYRASMLMCDYRQIRYIARRTGVKLAVEHKHGLPYVISKHKNRTGLAVGLAFFILFTQIAGMFVWTVEVHGVETLSESEIISTLSENGLYCGAFKNSINLQYAESTLMQQVEGIGWMSVNLIGTKAEIEIKEKEVKPTIIPYDEPCNIKAKTDGIIKHMNTKNGTAVMKAGSAVMEGQLLVSSVVENSLGQVRFVHADAQVLADTIHKETFSAEKYSNSKVYYDTAVRSYLKLFWLKIPLSVDVARGDYTYRTVHKRLYLNETPVEFGTATQRCNMYIPCDYTLTDETAKERLYNDEMLYRFFSHCDCLSVDAQFDYSESFDSYSLNVSYLCSEDIAFEQKLIVN